MGQNQIDSYDTFMAHIRQGINSVYNLEDEMNLSYG